MPLSLRPRGVVNIGFNAIELASWATEYSVLVLSAACKTQGTRLLGQWDFHTYAENVWNFNSETYSTHGQRESENRSTSTRDENSERADVGDTSSEQDPSGHDESAISLIANFKLRGLRVRPICGYVWTIMVPCFVTYVANLVRIMHSLQVTAK